MTNAGAEFIAYLSAQVANLPDEIKRTICASHREYVARIEAEATAAAEQRLRERIEALRIAVPGEPVPRGMSPVAEKALGGTSELALPKQRHEHPGTWCAACLVHSQAMAWLGKPLL